MKYLRATLIALALAAAAIGFAAVGGISVEQGAAACQKCGDGYCARSCENERTCPQDCGPRTAR
jgi:hypothetical protein